MKIKTEHYRIIRDKLRPILEAHQGLTQDRLLESERLRWDTFWHAIDPALKSGELSYNREFGYLNDAHIDTAIKAIIREYYSGRTK